MISNKTDYFSSFDRHPGSDVNDPSEGVKKPIDCTNNLGHGRTTNQSNWNISKSPNQLCSSTNDSKDSIVISHFPTIDPQHERPSPIQIHPNPNHVRPDLTFRQSSSSLASSIQTVIHLTSNTLVDPTSTHREVRGSFAESESDSSQLLAQIALKSSGENHLDPNSEALVDSQIQTNGINSKIQFHDIVRIAGGISSNPKRKQTRKQSSRRISVDRDARLADEQRTAGSSSRSPLRYSVLVEGLPNYPRRKISDSDCSDAMSAGHRQSKRLDPHDYFPSPVRRSFSKNRQNNLRPGPQSARSSFSYQSRSDSLSPSKLNNFNPHSTSNPTGFPLSLPHSLSPSSSFAPSSHFPTTITSRSSSPASSLYFPLRIPMVRAPAPFFGPTPERVARVKERRQVAQRDAERAQGGWKAWWNNWYHHSDKFANRKGKGKQDPNFAHDHQNFHSNPREASDSDDGSCYHDLILEHEREKLERKLKKLEEIRANLHSTQSQSYANQNKKNKPNHSKKKTQNRTWWLSWISNFSIGLHPPPLHPLKLPTPGTGILRPPVVTANSILPGKLVSSLGSDPSCTSHSEIATESLETVQEVNYRTPLLAQSQKTSHYGNEPIKPQASLPSTSNDENSKSSTEIRFGPAPRRWFTIIWWRWKIGRSIRLCWLKIATKLDEMFRIDWDASTRYEGWENV